MPRAIVRGLAATALACLSLSPAFAADSAEDQITLSREVSYADLDLSDQAGVAKLHQRVRSAARSICDFRGLGPVPEMRLRRGCMNDVLERASDDIELAVLAKREDRMAALPGTLTLARR